MPAASHQHRSASHSARWVSWVAPVTVLAVTAIAFLPALQGSFLTWDDDRNFVTNTAYRGLGPDQLHWMWTTFHMGHYVPLTWMTLGLDYVLWGMNPHGYHLTNLALHCAAAAALYAVARQLLAAGVPGASRERLAIAAAAGALLWSVHPLRVESVAWVTERRDVLSALLAFASVGMYLRSIGPGRRVAWYVAAVVAFAAALLAKASVMPIPVALLALNVYPLRRIGGEAGYAGRDAGKVYLELAPFAALAAGAAALSVIALNPPEQLGFAAKVAVSSWSFVSYAGDMLLPVALAPLHEMPKVIDPLGARYLVAYCGVAVTCIAAWALRRQWPAVTAAMVIFIALLLPTLGVVQNGPQITADRYTYQAAPALSILVGALLLVASRRDALVRVAVAAWVAILAVATWRQTTVWQTSEALWSRVVAIDPGSSIGQLGIAGELARQGHPGDAADAYRRAISIDPSYAEAHNNLGVVLLQLGRAGEAVAEFRRAAELKPGYAEAYSNWGNALGRLGDPAAAIAMYRRSVEADPTFPDAHVNWGNALVRMDSASAALPHYEAALAIRGEDAQARFNWGVALARLSRWADAAAQFRAALAIDPGMADARTYLERVERSARPR